jgi:hypothetical protein
VQDPPLGAAGRDVLILLNVVARVIRVNDQKAHPLPRGWAFVLCATYAFVRVTASRASRLAYIGGLAARAEVFPPPCTESISLAGPRLRSDVAARRSGGAPSRSARGERRSGGTQRDGSASALARPDRRCCASGQRPISMTYRALEVTCAEPPSAPHEQPGFCGGQPASPLS